MEAHDPQYIVFIRVPFPRGSFVDPPFVRFPLDSESKTKLLGGLGRI